MADDVLRGGGGVSSEPTDESGGGVVGKNYLLLIGINKYEDAVAFPQLHNCISDVEK
ncbi:MAG: hypothetical protein IPN76_20855 [Saprospiraceae bacterium]|nr:hypothetical protein [Saprospiraceae bacterium]